jgi:hypothetical protein
MIITGAITFKDNKGGAAISHHNEYFRKVDEKNWNIEKF